MKECVVLYDDWQMQCCGTPFRIGDAVTWVAKIWTSGTLPIDVGTIDYYYEAHSSDYKNLFSISGTITEIQALHLQYEKTPDSPQVLVPVGGFLVNVLHADGNDAPVNGLPFGGYIVRLEDV